MFCLNLPLIAYLIIPVTLSIIAAIAGFLALKHLFIKRFKSIDDRIGFLEEAILLRNGNPPQ